jgi:hypothetical protein
MPVLLPTLLLLLPAALAVALAAIATATAAALTRAACQAFKGAHPSETQADSLIRWVAAPIRRVNRITLEPVPGDSTPIGYIVLGDVVNGKVRRWRRRRRRQRGCLRETVGSKAGVRPAVAACAQAPTSSPCPGRFCC